MLRNMEAADFLLAQTEETVPVCKRAVLYLQPLLRAGAAVETKEKHIG